MATLTGVMPNTGPLAGGTSVTLTGTVMGGTSAVQFGGVAATNVQNVNTTTVTCVTPAGSTAGLVDVYIVSTGGNSTLSASFEYLAPAPTLSMVMPNTGLEAGGTSVTLTGSDFTGATAVQFGSPMAMNMTVVSDTQITCMTPAGTGTVDVTIQSPNGNTTLAQAFAYQPPPPAPTGHGLCSTCFFWDPTGAVNPTQSGPQGSRPTAQFGLCRHSVPTAAVAGRMPAPRTTTAAAGAPGVWPITSATDWCGLFEALKS